MKIEYLELNGLTECVCEHLRDCSTDIKDLQKVMEQVLEYGMNTGVIPSLIYTSDIVRFAESHLVDIFDTLDDMLDGEIINEVPCDITKIVYLVFEYLTEKLYVSINWPAMIKKE